MQVPSVASSALAWDPVETRAVEDWPSTHASRDLETLQGTIPLGTYSVLMYVLRTWVASLSSCPLASSVEAFQFRPKNYAVRA